MISVVARTHMDVLSALSQTADAIGEGDIVSNLVRGGSHWSLLPTQVYYTHTLWYGDGPFLKLMPLLGCGYLYKLY